MSFLGKELAEKSLSQNDVSAAHKRKVIMDDMDSRLELDESGWSSVAEVMFIHLVLLTFLTPRYVFWKIWRTYYMIELGNFLVIALSILAELTHFFPVFSFEPPGNIRI